MDRVYVLTVFDRPGIGRPANYGTLDALSKAIDQALERGFPFTVGNIYTGELRTQE